MLTDPRPHLAKRRLTDFFEGAGVDGRRETVLALLRGRRAIVALLWTLCQGVVGLSALAATGIHGAGRLAGSAAISIILGLACFAVLWRDHQASVDLEGAGLERAWRRARDRSVSRLAIFSLSLVVGGTVAMLISRGAVLG